MTSAQSDADEDRRNLHLLVCGPRGAAITMPHRTDDLLACRNKAPYAAMQHPTEEHRLPLFVAAGAAGDGAPVTRLHASTTYSPLRMDAYAFG